MKEENMSLSLVVTQQHEVSQSSYLRYITKMIREFYFL